MAEFRYIKKNNDGSTKWVDVSEDNPFPVSTEITVEATIADSKSKGSTDGGTTWVPVKLDADGQMYIKKITDALPSGANKLGSIDISGSFDTLRAMLGATKTATSVASEVFAGASRKANRRGIAIKNEHPYLRLRIDGAAVTDTTGISLEPFAQAVFTLDPAVDIPVYVISEAGLVKYGVVEW